MMLFWMLVVCGWSTTHGWLLYASIGLVSRTSNKNFQPNNSYTHTHTVFRGIKGLGKICPFIGEIIAGVEGNVTMLSSGLYDFTIGCAI